MEGKLVGWKEIDEAIYEIAQISEDTAKRRARRYRVRLPLHFDGGRIWCRREELEKWWAQIESRAQAAWEARRR